jgi:hypothetical protein
MSIITAFSRIAGISIAAKVVLFWKIVIFMVK